MWPRGPVSDIVASNVGIFNFVQLSWLGRPLRERFNDQRECE